MQLDDATSLKRIQSRRVCSGCGSIIYLNSKPRRLIHVVREIRNRCYHCGGTLVQRSDDLTEIVLKRLKLYHRETAPIIKYFSDHHLTHYVDANPSIDTVKDQIYDIINR